MTTNEIIRGVVYRDSYRHRCDCYRIARWLCAAGFAFGAWIAWRTL